MVRHHLQVAVAELCRLAPDLRAIYLSGGFGRGEGTVRRTARGWVPVNDYDLVVVGVADAARRLATTALGRRLAKELGIEYIDVGWLQLDTITTNPTLEAFDFQHGAQLVHGEDIRGLLPAIEADRIPGFDWVRLICNRAAGLHTLGWSERRGDNHYAASQVLKAWQAVGDAVVSVVDGYRPRAVARREVFLRLSEQGRLPPWIAPTDAAAILVAYDLKLQGWDGDPPLVRGEGIGSVLAETFCWLVATDLGEGELVLPDAIKRARNAYAIRSSSWWRNLGRALKRRHWGYCGGDVAFIARHVLFAQVAMAAAHDRGVAEERSEYRRQFWWVPGAWGLSPDGAGAGRLWERFSHG